MSIKSCSIQAVFCLLVAALPFSVATAMQQQSQELNPGRPVGVLPEFHFAIPPVAPSSFDEPVESSLFPESVEAIEWLSKNFGSRVEGDDIDRWIAQDRDVVRIDQRREMAKKRFAEARETLIAEVRDASLNKVNIEMFVGSLYTPDQVPVLICLRDGELFVIPLSDQYCRLRKCGPANIAIVSRRERFRTFQPMLTLANLQVDVNENSPDGTIILDVSFDATIDQPWNSDSLEFVVDFQQGNTCGTSIKDLEMPEDLSDEIGVRTQVKLKEGELDPGQPVLVFVTAVRTHGSSSDDFLKNSTRISNSVRMVLAVSVEE